MQLFSKNQRADSEPKVQASLIWSVCCSGKGPG